MKSSVLVALGGAVVAIGCATLLTQALGESPAREHDAVTAAATPPATPVTPEVLRVRGEVAALRAQVAGLDARERGAPAPSEPPREPTREEKLAADEDLHAAYLAQVEDAYQRDPADPAWSASTTTRVWATIRELDFLRDAARSVECRSRSCRIEVDDDGTGVLHKNLPVFGQQFADILPVLSGRPVRGEDGRQRMVLYLMEADQRPPAAKVN